MMFSLKISGLLENKYMKLIENALILNNSIEYMEKLLKELIDGTL
jgi:hypothetical protein